MPRAKTVPGASTSTGPPDPTVTLLAMQQLYETTRDICSRLDLEQALQAIVARANSLLDGDVAYLATCDETHQVMRMRAFDKVRSASFRGLVVPYDVGLGGAVATQRRPLTVEDLHNESDLHHTPEIDHWAQEEGLRAGVAAPVEFEDRLLAVLFVAKRSPYKFSPHQVTMLASLANAAAIAINNAQIHGRLIATMGIHQSLMDIALADQGPVAVTRTLSGLIGGPARFLDWQGTVIADIAVEGCALPTMHVPQDQATDAHDDQSTTVPILIGGVLEGFLVAAPDGSDPELAGVAIEQTVTVLALELMKMRSAEQVELRLRGGVFSEILSYPPTDETRLLRQADQLGCDLREPHVIAVLQFLDKHPRGATAAQPWQRLTHIMSATCQQAGLRTLMVDRGDAIAIMIETGSDPTAHEVIQRGLEQAKRAQLPPVVAGLGGIASTLEGYPQSFAEATRAVDVAGRLSTLGGLVRFEDLGFHQVVLGARPTADLLDLAQRVLTPLISHDAGRGTELVATARAFLEANGNVEAMARRLGLHPNTVRARIARINKLLGRDLDNSRTRLDVHLALETLLLASTDSPSGTKAEA